uniref:Uncharacterized protein n=1 Tax=Arundo donax TaxID=35708 RepID=A0A0A8Y2D9_ARUDO
MPVPGAFGGTTALPTTTTWSSSSSLMSSRRSTRRRKFSPGKFGFSTALQACCGAGGQGNYNFNLKKKCGKQGASVCSNPSSYVSWDGIHMTEAAYRKIANGWLNGLYAQPPILKN